MPRAERRAGRYGLLLLATIASVFVQGVVEPSGVQQVVVTALAGGTLVLAFRAGGLAPRLARAVLVFAAAALVVAIVRATAGGIGEGAARAMNAALVALAPPAVAIGLLRELRATQEVRLAAVSGVLCLYVLVGMAFGFIYGAIDNLGGDPFFANGNTRERGALPLLQPHDAGDGRATATSSPGATSGTRSSVSEAMIGQIYLVTVVSLIVSNLRRPEHRAQAP